MHVGDLNARASPLLSGATWSFVTRRVRRAAVRLIDGDLAAARSGDLVPAEVQAIGSHTRLQLSDGRFPALFPRDRLVLACGNRFANGGCRIWRRST